MLAVILAGGFGTRLAAVNTNRPKALTPLLGKSVILWQIEALRAEGVREFILVTGYLGDRIEAELGDGSALGVQIRYFREQTPLGTAGALFRLGLTEDFLLLNGDLVFSFDLGAMAAFHWKHNALATLFCHPSAHPFDSAVIDAREEGKIAGFFDKLSKPEIFPNLCNAGIAILSPALLSMYPQTGPADLDRDVLIPAVSTGRLFAYKSSEYVKDMGTPERLAAAEQDLDSGIVEKKRKTEKHRAVFLDRDGTLNVYRGYITSPDALSLLPGAAKAVRMINRAGDLAVLVTNQPVVARGDCTMDDLRLIGWKLETLLGKEGAFLDGIYLCPHHPEQGFPGENPALKMDCDCRKPKPGLVFRAAEDLNIDLPASYFAGDTLRDVQTAQNAGCRPVFLQSGKENTPPPGVPVFEDLLAFTDALYGKVFCES